MKKLFYLFWILIVLSAGPLFAADAVFTPSEWNFGSIKAGTIAEQKLTIENKNKIPLELTIMSTCDCLSPENASLSIKPNEKGTVTLKYDSKDDSGAIKKMFIIRSNFKSLPKAFYKVHGTVIAGNNNNSASSASAQIEKAETANAINLYYYYTPGCKKCEKFLRETIPSLEKETGKTIVMHKRDVLDAKVFEEYQKKLDQLGVTGKAFPVIINGNNVIQGNEEIVKNIRNFLTQTNLNTSATNTAAGTQKEKQGLFMVPVILAGLLDGINPCAFTTLIFLLSYLAIAGRSRKEILVIGIFFTVSVFITYYLIGLGFFHALRAAESVPLIGLIIKWTLVGVLAVFAGLSLYDYYLVKTNRSTEILLQLPETIKKQLHKSIRTYVKSAALIGSSVVLGFLVSVFELACTGQVYFPTITYYLQVQKNVSLYFFLAVYNLCFILPLVIVFIFTYAGISSKKITESFQKNMGAVKLGTAILFVGLAVMVVLF
jgi:cytochrome c biogenesis protein CcdA